MTEPSTTARPAIVRERRVSARSMDELDEWIRSRRDDIEAVVHDAGMVHLRDLPVRTPEDAEKAAKALFPRLFEPVGHDSQVDKVGASYTISDGPPSDATCLRSPLSHTTRPPRFVMQFCLRGAQEGGHFTVGSNSVIAAAAPTQMVDQLRDTGWLLRRSFNDVLGVHWKECFQVQSDEELAAFCAKHEIDLDRSSASVITTQRRAAFATDRSTGEECWFNSVLYLSRWSLDAEVRDLIVDMYGPRGLPFDVFYGDGELIPQSDIRALARIYRAATSRLEARAGDALITDNLRTSIGRDAFSGRRRIVTLFARPFEHDGVQGEEVANG